MKLKTKKIPVIIDIGFAKFLRYYEQVELQESTFKRVCKVLKRASSIICFFSLLISLVVVFNTNNKSIIFINGFTVALTLIYYIISFVEEFKK